MEDEFELFDDEKDEERVGFVGNEIVGFDRMEILRFVDGNKLCERDFFEPRRLIKDRFNDISDSSLIVDSDSTVTEDPFSIIVLKR